jgi:hypothetical protein
MWEWEYSDGPCHGCIRQVITNDRIRLNQAQLWCPNRRARRHRSLLARNLMIPSCRELRGRARESLRDYREPKAVSGASNGMA